MKQESKNLTTTYTIPDAIKLCYQLLEQGEYNKVNEICNKILVKNPQNIDAMYLLAAVEKEKKNFDKSMFFLNKIINIKPNNFYAHNELGRIYFELNNFQQAIKSFILAADINPSSALIIKNLGISYKNLGNLAKALFYYKKAFAIDKLNPDILSGLASIYYSFGKYSDTENLFLDALAVSKEHYNSLLGIAKLYVAMSKIDLAKIYYNRFLKIYPLDENICNDLGALYYKLFNYNKAKLYFKKAISLNSDSYAAYSNLALLYYNDGKFNESIRFSKKSLNSFFKVRKIDKIFKAELVKDVDINLFFNDLSMICKKNNIKIFLAFGTLLGYVRDKNLISYDKDLDFGVFENIDKIKKVFLSSDKFEIIDNNINYLESIKFIIKHKNNVAADLFIFKEKNKKLFAGFLKGKFSHLWEFSKFNLEKINFLGEEFYIPDNFEKYLEEIYGKEWRTPDKYFDSILSGYNVVDKFSDLVRSLTYSNICINLSVGNTKKVLRYIKELKRINGNDEVVKICNKNLSFT